MQLWFNFYNAVFSLWTPGAGWYCPDPQGLKRFQDPLPFLHEVLPDFLCLQAGTESGQCPSRSEAWTRLPSISLISPVKRIFLFMGRTDDETEPPILWPPDVKNWLFRKDPDAGKDWMQEEKGIAEDEMVGWHHWPNGHEFEQAPGVGDIQGSLVCCSPWGRKESDTTEWLNWTELNISKCERQTDESRESEQRLWESVWVGIPELSFMNNSGKKTPIENSVPCECIL